MKKKVYKASKVKILVPADRSEGWKDNVVQLSAYSERLSEAYAEIAGLTLDEVTGILDTPELNAEFKKLCNHWRAVQATLDCCPPNASQEQQRFALSQLKVICANCNKRVVAGAGARVACF